MLWFFLLLKSIYKFLVYFWYTLENTFLIIIISSFSEEKGKKSRLQPLIE